MLRFAFAVLLACVTPIASAQVTVDSASARGVLQSLGDADLSLSRAKEVCALPGNQGLIRKENSYGRAATTQSCAEALMAAAHGTPADPACRFRFDALKPRTAELGALLDRIEANPVGFQQWVVARVGQFSPPDAKIAIAGHLVVGGVSGGFAFGKPEFFLDLGYFPDFDVARVVMAHELYHAVQGAYAPAEKSWWSEKDAGHGPDGALAQQCSTDNDLLDALYEEGW